MVEFQIMFHYKFIYRIFSLFARIHITFIFLAVFFLQHLNISNKYFLNICTCTFHILCINIQKVYDEPVHKRKYCSPKLKAAHVKWKGFQVSTFDGKALPLQQFSFFELIQVLIIQNKITLLQQNKKDQSIKYGPSH